jgi:hypothetical protein
VACVLFRREVSTMIGIWQAYAGIYLTVVGIATLAAFGIPLLVAPMAWAQIFRWEIPQPQELVTFLGRSLGALISVVGLFAIKVARTPQDMPLFFEFTIWLFVANIALHLYGAIKKAQPITETVEIALWVVLLLVTLAFYPA